MQQEREQGRSIQTKATLTQGNLYHAHACLSLNVQTVWLVIGLPLYSGFTALAQIEESDFGMLLRWWDGTQKWVADHFPVGRKQVPGKK